MRDARRFGLSETAVAAIRARLMGAADDNADGVWPENAAIVAIFLSVSTQWRVTTIGGGLLPAQVFFIGLDYAGARAGIEAAGLTLTPEMWEGVRIMEAEAREALNGIKG